MSSFSPYWVIPLNQALATLKSLEILLCASLPNTRSLTDMRQGEICATDMRLRNGAFGHWWRRLVKNDF